MLCTANILREAKDLGQQLLMEKIDTTFSWGCGCAQCFRIQGHLPSCLNKGFCEQVFKHEIESFGCGMKYSFSVISKHSKVLC